MKGVKQSWLIVMGVLVLTLVSVAACAEATPTPTPRAATATPTPQATPTPIVKEVVKEVKVFNLTFTSSDQASNPTYKNVIKPILSDMKNRSKGQLNIGVFAADELGTDQFLALRILKTNAFDMGTATASAVGGDSRLAEGMDLVGVYPDMDTAIKGFNAYAPVVAQDLEKKINVKLISQWANAFNVIHCKTQVSGLADIKGKKVRGFGSAIADLVNELGGTPVTVAFAEVYAALERGVVDCAITQAAAANNAKWFEVTKYLFNIPIIAPAQIMLIHANTWNSLTPELQKLLTDMVLEIQNLSNDLAKRDLVDATVCSTGGDPCTRFTKSNLTLVTPSQADLQLIFELSKKLVLPKWVARCGADCKTSWNNTIGKVVNYQIP